MQNDYFCRMKKRSVVFSLFILLWIGSTLPATAQLADNVAYNIWNVKPGDTLKVYARSVNVRNAASLKAPLQDSLVCGTPVIIQEQGSVLEHVKGIAAPWVKVQYYIDKRNVTTGYLWLGALALGSYTKESTSFLFGIEKIIPGRNKEEEDFKPAIWSIRVKAMDNTGALLDEKEVKLEDLGIVSATGKLLGDLGVSNTEDILRIWFSGEACGIPTYFYYFGWSGKHFLPLPGKMEVSDAGVFYHSENMLFPKEPGGQPDKIILLVEEGEADEKKVDKLGGPVYHIEKSRRTYLWDGVKAKKI